jgi:hypothetical protein
LIRNLTPFACTPLARLVDGVRYLLLCLSPSFTLAAENLLLRKHLALYQERYVQPRRGSHATPEIPL